MSSDFEIVLTYFIAYETYFIVCGFYRNIRGASVYFIVYASLRVSGHASAGPLWE
jgi:hypothetical protein